MRTHAHMPSGEGKRTRTERKEQTKEGEPKKACRQKRYTDWEKEAHGGGRGESSNVEWPQQLLDALNMLPEDKRITEFAKFSKKNLAMLTGMCAVRGSTPKKIW